ncbi:MAG: acyl--CoA ligase [Ruminococcaceae bacterium]|nr:acyl--CoA ligase [Oscillospiraceae bacterium]
MPITAFLEKNADLYPNDICLVERTPAENARRAITWKEFDDAANRFANLLLSYGVTKGDKIAILLTNCLEWLPIYFGILKTGALAVPFNFRYSAEEIANCLKISDSSLLIYGSEFIERIESISDFLQLKKRIFVGDGHPALTVRYEEEAANMSSARPNIAIDDEDDGALYFTSGTTGVPKAILHRHKALVCACVTEQAHHSQTKDDTFLCIPPLYHTGAIMHWFGSLLVGGKGVLMRGVKPQWILQAVSEEQISIIWLLVPWAQDLLDAIDRGDIDLSQYDLSRLRLMHIGAQPVPPSLVNRWLKRFPTHQYDTNYGLSESIGPGCVHLGVENTHKVGAIGVPGYRWQVRIVDSNANDVKDGDVGELAVKGDGVMKCYYKDEKATNRSIKDGWLLTGDMAMKDKDGFIYLVDRKKDLIISGGENIFPVQIEDHIRQHDAVKDVAVIGIPDQRLGEVVAAIIEIKKGFSCTEEEMRLHCETLPRYKRPHTILFEKVPRNPTGKIEKPLLRRMYGGGNLIIAQMK